jgi:type II secretion system protein J
MRRAAGGFTLAELLIAVSMVALVLGPAYATYAATAASARRCAAIAGRQQEARGVLRIMARELRCAYHKPLEADAARTAIVVQGPPQFSGGTGGKLLDFVTAGGMSGPDADAAGLSKVVYRYEASVGALMRRQTRLAGRPADEGTWEALARDVRQVSVEFCDGAEWRTEWDSNDEDGLPAAVRVTVTLGSDEAGASSYATTIPLTFRESPADEVTIETVGQ